MEDGYFTSEFVHVQFANNSMDSLPFAMVDVDTPFVKGRIAAACLTVRSGIKKVCHSLKLWPLMEDILVTPV